MILMSLYKVESSSGPIGALMAILAGETPTFAAQCQKVSTVLIEQLAPASNAFGLVVNNLVKAGDWDIEMLKFRPDSVLESYALGLFTSKKAPGTLILIKTNPSNWVLKMSKPGKNQIDDKLRRTTYCGCADCQKIREEQDKLILKALGPD